jgi:hypothetical protein
VLYCQRKNSIFKVCINLKILNPRIQEIWEIPKFRPENVGIEANKPENLGFG